MSKLLLDDYPILLLKSLAKMGLSAVEAAILQQVHYWTNQNRKNNKNYHQGAYWTYNTYEQWAEELAFWSVRTVQRAITSLEKKELIIVGNFNKLKIDQTKWYRINYQAVNSLELVSGNGHDKMARPTCQNGTLGENKGEEVYTEPEIPVDYDFTGMRLQYLLHNQKPKGKRGKGYKVIKNPKCKLQPLDCQGVPPDGRGKVSLG